MNTRGSLARRKRDNLRWLLILVPLLLLSSSAEARVQKCLICHGKPDFKKVDTSGRVKHLYVDEDVIKRSVHAKKTCTGCHFDAIEIPHREAPQRVHCVRCHYRGNPEGAPQSDKYLEYNESVHGKQVAKGTNKKAPLCQDCHGDHEIRHTKDPLAQTAHLNVARTCGKCHIEIYAVYMNSIHGRSTYEKKNPDTPDCTGCHGEHSILSPKDLESTVYPIGVVKTCSHCHAEIGIVGKYGIEVEQVATYEDSFHGIGLKYGLKTAASCASCHGTHNILPHDDPRSSVYIENIPRTCGKCHPGANINYARGKIHIDPSKRSAGIVFYVAFLFKWLTILVILGLITHIGLDLYRRSSQWRELKKNQRM